MYRIDFFGWCKTDKHDKIWGYATVQNEEVYSFWGRRGKPISFQRHPDARSALAKLSSQQKSKTKIGRSSGTYQPIPIEQIETVWEGFIEEFELQLMTAKLSNRYRYGQEEEDE